MEEQWQVIVKKAVCFFRLSYFSSRCCPASFSSSVTGACFENEPTFAANANLDQQTNSFFMTPRFGPVLAFQAWYKPETDLIGNLIGLRMARNMSSNPSNRHIERCWANGQLQIELLGRTPTFYHLSSFTKHEREATWMNATVVKTNGSELDLLRIVSAVPLQYPLLSFDTTSSS